MISSTHLCDRTGLDVDPAPCSADELHECLASASEQFKENGSIRFEHKALNDHLVKIVLDIAGRCKKPSKLSFRSARRLPTYVAESPVPHRCVAKQQPRSHYLILIRLKVSETMTSR
jgi:hypothetical protein